MSNPITPKLVQGSVGELLVQIRLLQFDVQAAPPLKDSGNDLIAVRALSLKTIQVKTVAGKTYSVKDLPEFYDLLAVVQLVGENAMLRLDRSRVFLIPKHRVREAPRQIKRLNDFALSREHVDDLFGARHLVHYGQVT